MSIAIDWQRVVLNIRKAGLSCAQQDRRIGRRGDYTQRIANGEVARVWFEEGVVLLDLHLQFCPEQHELDQLQRNPHTAARQFRNVDKAPNARRTAMAIHSATP